MTLEKAKQELEKFVQLKTTLRPSFVDVLLNAEEVKHGHWIVDDEYIDCSCCRHEKWSRVPYEQLVSRFRFCPNCGAKMDEVTDGDSDN